MKEPKKEIIQGITDLFEDYEETYVPGEWEAFSKQQKKKYPFSPLWIKIAALLVVAGAAVLFQLYKAPGISNKPEVANINHNIAVDTITGRFPQTESAPAVADNKPDLSQQVPVNLPLENIELQFTDTVRFKPLIPEAAFRAPAPVLAQAGKLVEDTLSLVKPDKYIAKTSITEFPGQYSRSSGENLTKITQRADTGVNSTTMEFLIAESRNPVQNSQKRVTSSKWNFGVALAPSMSRSNMNIAGGVTTAYKLSDKFALSSGVSLVQLESGTSVTAPSLAKASVSSLSDKQLLAVDANIRAVDIPVGIVYQLNKNIYTSAGVSYFSVVSEKRSNTYGLTAQASETFSNPVTGYTSDRTVLNSVAVAEPVAETPLKGKSYLGFFNFSIGRKQQIFNKYDILIEPFIKVPIGKLSTQELNLMNSGLKFQINF
jgi:hypothetical protein